jgi:hypothetical protein
MKLAAAFALPLVVSFALVQAATQVVGVPQAATARSTSIVWSGRVFVTHQQFARWLRARGASYSHWARNHPQLAGRQPTTAATGLERLDRSRTVRLLRTLVIGVGLASGALLAIGAIAHLRARRSRIYVPVLAGSRGWPVPTSFRPRSRMRTGGAKRRSVLLARTASVAAATTADVPRRRGTPLFTPQRAGIVDRLRKHKNGSYALAAVVGAGFGAVLAYFLS